MIRVTSLLPYAKRLLLLLIRMKTMLLLMIIVTLLLPYAKRLLVLLIRMKTMLLELI